MLIKLKRGLDLPETRASYRRVEPAPSVAQVGVVGADYRDLKPSLQVAEGDHVRAGQTLFTHRPTAELCFPAPGSGRVSAIHRGPKRALESVVIELENPEHPEQPVVHDGPLNHAGAAAVRRALLASGLWAAFRTRPFDRVPAPSARPRTLFVTAMDTAPYAMDPAAAIAPRSADFRAGLECLTRLESQHLFVCTAADGAFEVPDVARVQHVRFGGPHPAGLPGTHIHFLDPQVSLGADTWHLGYQDTLAIGVLYRTGRLDLERIVAVAGPSVGEPRLLLTRLGADLTTLLGSPLEPGQRLISGSILGGRATTEHTRFLSRYHSQVSLLPERAASSSGVNLRRFVEDLRCPRRYGAAGLSSALHGAPTGMLPVEAFDAVWPLRDPPALLLRALLTGDDETATQLGCLALGAEDLALCSWVCPGKINYGRALDDVLVQLEQRG